MTLKIDDSFFFDTKVSEEILGTLKKTAKVNKKIKALIDPSDHFDVFTNLDAIPVENRTVTMALLVVGLVVIAVNTLIGLHDQAVPEMQTFLYSDGDSSSPLFKSLVASGSIWLMIKKQLRKYMKFDLKGSMGQIDRTSSIPIQQLIFGHCRVELNNATLRVVAGNLEKGQYVRDVRGSGSKQRTISFSEPVRGVLLYEKTVETIPPKQPVENHFAGNVEFAPMFDALYPPIVASKSHGLDVHWEVQLLVKDLIDQELIGNNNWLRNEDFYSDGS